MEDFRKIIREEVALALREVAKEAYSADDYDTGELKSAGLQAVGQVAGSVAKAIGARVNLTCPECGEMPDDHWWKCSRKDQG